MNQLGSRSDHGCAQNTRHSIEVDITLEILMCHVVYGQELQVTDIALATGMSRQGVIVCLERAMKKIRKRLKL